MPKKPTNRWVRVSQILFVVCLLINPLSIDLLPIPSGTPLRALGPLLIAALIGIPLICFLASVFALSQIDSSKDKGSRSAIAIAIISGLYVVLAIWGLFQLRPDLAKGLPAGFENGRLLVYDMAPCDFGGHCMQQKIYFGVQDAGTCTSLGGTFKEVREMSGEVARRVCAPGATR